ncbi:hypothetical protein ACVW0P_004529, partial [Mucilaginibacter sp. UYNi724]
QFAPEWGGQFDAESLVTFRRNWVVNISGISNPWPSWQNNIEQAKRKALICLYDAIRHVFEYERENRIGRIE